MKTRKALAAGVFVAPELADIEYRARAIVIETKQVAIPIIEVRNRGLLPILSTKKHIPTAEMTFTT